MFLRSTALPFCLGFAFLLSGPAPAQHPQAVSDCSNCHQDRSTGMPDLQAVHGFQCDLCHSDFNFSRTILGPNGSWNHECSACHNEDMVQTGNLPDFTKGHRCVVCHGRQMPTGDARKIHEEHTDRANCVVCHGFTPDMGTTIGSGNRAVCIRCHDGDELDAGTQRFHREMVPEDLSCLECHGGTRPPIDVVPGAPVGNAVVVCDICHSGADPTLFHSRGAELHEKHTKKRLGCGSCHADANLQDDRELMPAIDDMRRMMVDRSGFNECALCHQDGRSASLQTVHQKHVGKQLQWCYNCHQGTDLRPSGQAPPVTTPKEACSLCHQGRQYNDGFPFDLHEKHAEKNKCYSCHQGTPPLEEWPQRWWRRPGVLTTYGEGCSGSNGLVPAMGGTGRAALGQSFEVTLTDAPASAAAFLALGRRGQVLDLSMIWMPGCEGLVVPRTTTLFMTSASGEAAFTQLVPADPQLVGLAFYFQWFALDPQANPVGVISSAGLRISIGR